MIIKNYVKSTALGLLFLTPGLIAMEVELLQNVSPETEVSKKLGRELWFAAQEGNEAKVRELLANQVTDVNYRLPYRAMKFDSFTPLMIAVTYNRPRVVALLVADKRTDVTLVNKNERTAFHGAVRAPACLKVLLDAQKAGMLNPPLDVNQLGSGGRTALFAALEDHAWTSACMLSEVDGIDPNVYAEGCLQRPLDAVKGASRNNFNVPLEEQNEQTGTYEMLCKIFFNLVERGLFVEAKMKNEVTPFDHSFNRQHIGCILWPLLCAFGAKATEHERNGFFIVSSCEAMRMQNFLSRFLWCTLPTISSDPNRPLIQYSQIGFDREMRGDAIAQPDSYGLTPCMIIAAQGDTTLFAFYSRLLDDSVVNARTWNGWRPIHFAAYNGHGKMVQYLRSLPVVEACAKIDSGLTVCALAKLGAQARFKVTGKLDNAAVEVCNEYNKRRMAFLLALVKVAEEGNFNLPGELLTRLVNAYRF